MLLTGFAPILPTNEIGLAAQALLFPANISAPQYAKLSPAYLIFDSRADFDFLFYYPPKSDINMQTGTGQLVVPLLLAKLPLLRCRARLPVTIQIRYWLLRVVMIPSSAHC
jgi:hypothetical protein